MYHMHDNEYVGEVGWGSPDAHDVETHVNERATYNVTKYVYDNTVPVTVADSASITH